MKIHFSFFFIFILLYFSSAFPQAGKVGELCPNGMISYWQLDEFGDVSMFADSYGGHFATVENSNHPSQDSGVVNSSRFFYSSSAVDVANNNIYNWGPHTSFSIELWMKTKETGTGNKVFIGRYSNNNQTAWWLGFGSANKAIFSVRDSAGIESDLVGSKIINDGKWHHIVGIRNDSLKVLELFVDGVEENIVSTFFKGDFSGDSPIYIGYYSNGFHYSGWLDEIAAYDVVLTKNQVEKHYNDGLSGKPYCNQFTTDVESNTSIPTKYSLNQNYPNPFNPSTTITFSIPYGENVKLIVYNILGENISTLINGPLSAGFYKAQFRNDDLPSGIYFYELQANNFLMIKKMVLLR